MQVLDVIERGSLIYPSVTTGSRVVQVVPVAATGIHMEANRVTEYVALLYSLQLL